MHRRWLCRWDVVSDEKKSVGQLVYVSIEANAEMKIDCFAASMQRSGGMRAVSDSAAPIVASFYALVSSGADPLQKLHIVLQKAHKNVIYWQTDELAKSAANEVRRERNRT